MGNASQISRKTGRASRTFLREAEENGIALRHRAGLGAQGRLDPFAAQEALGIVVIYPEGLEGLAQVDREQLRAIDARTWSGGAQPLPDGRLLILLNPNQTVERATVTVMEEVAHTFLGHRPTKLDLQPTGLAGRCYDIEAENEAYWAAAAALLPSRVVAHAVWNSMSAEALAAEYGVSVELVEFRIKTLKLWRWYNQYRAAA